MDSCCQDTSGVVINILKSQTSSSLSLARHRSTLKEDVGSFLSKLIFVTKNNINFKTGDTHVDLLCFQYKQIKIVNKTQEESHQQCPSLSLRNGTVRG